MVTRIWRAFCIARPQSSDPNMLFQWTRLALNQFRLLEVRSFLPTGEPSFVLKTFTFSSPSLPKYAAMTYVHSSSEGDRKSESVVINGRSMSVHKEVLDALKMVGAAQYEYLWLDALCINTRDDWEKQGAREMARRVFEAAPTVIACFDENRPGTSEFVRFTKHVLHDTEPEGFLPKSLQSFVETWNTLGSLSTSENGLVLWSGSNILTKSAVVLQLSDWGLQRELISKAMTALEKYCSSPRELRDTGPSL